jgi:signal transduction histidine kinase
VLAWLGMLTWLVYRLSIGNERRTLIAYAEAVVTGVMLTVTGADQSPLLPYLLSPGLALGLLAGRRAVLLGAALAGTAMAVTATITENTAEAKDFAVAAAEWLLLGLAVGLVAAWARRLMNVDVQAVDRYAEARSLLEQLRTVTRGMPRGLDAAAAAEALLAEANRLLPHTRSALLVQTVRDGALVPVAVRGTRRVPWRAPLTAPGPLRSAWESCKPVVDRRKPDIRGRRAGSVIAAVPLLGKDAPYGLLVLEGPADSTFTEEELRGVVEAAAAASLRIETALLFDEVRSQVMADERDRLAREMHDGVGQDLAFLGYRLDELRAIAAKTDPELAGRVSDLRKDMTELISNLRLSITDLKTTVSPDRGLGAALGSYIRALASGRQLTVHLTLDESPFRLPADRELALFQLAQLFAQDVREKGRARNLWVTLKVDPPSARLVVEHDDDAEAQAPDFGAVSETLIGLGGSLLTSPRRGGGTRVEAEFEREGDGDPGPAG